MAGGLAEAAAGVDRAPDDVAAARLACCASCDQQTATLGVRRCGLCSCVLAAKARVAGEQCPAGRW